MKPMSLLIAILLVGTVSFGATASAMPLLPTGLNAGDTYQFAFRTSTSLTGDSTNRSLYDDFAQLHGDALLTTLGLDPFAVTWKAILSMSGDPVDARDHAVVSGSVYNVNDQKVADDFSDMWDGSLAASIGYDENGTLSQIGVWTGSRFDGTGFNARRVGDPLLVHTGLSTSTNSSWITDGNSPRGLELPVYALSSVIMVPGTTVPEPATFMLFGTGLVGLVAWRVRRKTAET